MLGEKLGMNVRWAVCNQSERSNKPWSSPTTTAFSFPFEDLGCEMPACREAKYESNRGMSTRRARSEGDEGGRRKSVATKKGWTIS
jgi:hypothetical protein